MAPPPSLQFTKVSVINTALILTGNNPVNTPDDGSAEWIVGSEAYEAALPVLLASRDWKFQSNIVALQRSGDSTLPGYTDSFGKPNDCLYIKAAWRTDDAQNVIAQPYVGDEPFYQYPNLPPLDYQILGDQIQANAPNGVTVKYTALPSSPAGLPVLFIEALRRFVMAGILAGLNEDQGAADSMEKRAEQMLSVASSRSDSEQPRRVTFRSPLLEARRRRRGG